MPGAKSVTIIAKDMFDSKAEKLEERFSAIAANILKSGPESVIFIATHYPNAILLIKQIKDAGVENQILVEEGLAE